ncbi:hypothetical protein COZ40_02775 [Candidatus Roizmanbacteria bacterium CG_4_10_14_3_um_filter_39_13]|uniref:Uncharacterized protein n=1 Tax=Candidatus Roizmanbacteria bacterium CG_4_10_14_3_um_filter_39_13 TaxID=1974831 RepID=A0A2M7LKE2_9BACT|nr:MAG: hypothetical protein COZ40_02775 [Candidatus Roizmanbacteria bacterium CG_4_10_14_3_um_filter_39_13]
MKLKQIEEIATRQIPIWQPTLLIILLLLGNVLIPMILKEKELKPPKKESLGSTLGIESIKKQVNEELKNVKPLTDQLQKEAEKVLGVAQETVQQTVQNVATQSTEKAKEFVFDNTLGKVLQNINTLPADQQDLIKKAICK